MPRLTPEQRASLRSTNPDAVVMRSRMAPDDEFVFRNVGLAEFDAFLGAVNGADTTAKVYAHRTLARDCALWPSKDEFDAFAQARPGIVHAFGDELARRAGVNSELVSDAL